MSPELAGGLRDRMISTSLYNMVRDSLEALGWLGLGRQHLPINMISGPVPQNEPIEPNTLTVTLLDTSEVDAEIGSNAVELTHVVVVNFYAEPPPPDGNGGDALGRHVIGDVRAIIKGELPSIGRDRAVLEVYDYTLATPAVAFTCEFASNRVLAAKVHHANHPWEHWWYTCDAELTEDRW